MYQLIDGKMISAKIKGQIKQETSRLAQHGVYPCIAVIIVGEDHASQVYVRNKMKACDQTGIRSVHIELPEQTTTQELLHQVEQLEEREDVHGILVQLPLPKHIDEKTVLAAISPEKDVDGFHAQNIGHLVLGENGLVACTPKGILRMFDEMHLSIQGKHCVVIGRSNTVGKPVAHLMLARDATVTICHSKTLHLEQFTRQADILIVAMGHAKAITADMVKDGAIVIDVGMNRDQNNKLCGDVDFESVSHKASYITPVPGGVGMMTVAMLMENTLSAAKQQNGLV